MNMKYKKLVIAIQSAMMTSLICSALPSYASDIELYKSPQTTQTTLMFMMDVSGSMGDEDRIGNLKRGMIKLLQGDVATGIEPLPDRLVTGLSEFSSPDRNGPFGRVKLEARPLGEETILSGNRPVFQTQQTFSRPVTRTITESRKWTATNQSRTQSGTRVRDCGIWGNSWCNPSNWSPAGVNDGWTPTTINSSSGGSWGVTNSPDWTLIGTANATSGVINPKECISWNESNYNCTSWESSVKTVADFSNVTSNSENSAVGVGGVSDSAKSTPIAGSPEFGSITTGDASCSSTNCTRTQYRSAQITSTRTYTQTGTGTYTVTTTYYSTSAKETHRKKMIRAVNALNANGGTPTGYAYAEVAAYLMGQTTSGVSTAGSASGFSANRSNISDATNYIRPSAINSKTNTREYTIDSSKQCNTQGIYFLTDGAPTYYNSNGNNVRDQYKRSVLEDFMKKSLGAKGASFSCNNESTLGKYSSGYSSGSHMSIPNGWDCIGAYTNALLDPNSNPAGVTIKTAVVGFGSDFSNKSTSDEKDADKWGELGLGGSYLGNNEQDIVTSVNAFLKKLQKYIPPVTTGSVTIPVDNLDTQNIQPWGYFPQFDPQPDSKVNTWIGNLKKYEVKNNVLLDRDGKNIIDSTTQISVDDPNDFWSDNSIKKTITKIKRVGTADIEEDIEVRVGGALSQFKLGMVDSNERKIFTDRKIDAQGVGSTISDDSNLVQVKTTDLKTLNASNNFSKDPQRGYIAALFGYDVGATMAKTLETDTSTATQTNFSNYLTQSNATLRQMGAVMHSKPVLITQSGTTAYNDETGDLTYTDRDDLIVFGTTQGLLHIIRAGKTRTDSNAGKEVFTFMPNEMVENQSQGFLNQTQQGGTLNYGIDGQWTAYTEYVTKKTDNTSKEPEVTVKGGKQWLYGGLRMGGSSYYALDLSDVTSSGGTPKLKFKIDPANSTNSAIRYMGQSWSKPTLTWVNWQGERKLVMLVGGGYDNVAYESNINYSPSSSIDKGAGVYMFDADDGSLLWWSSANVGSNSTQNNATYAENMKRSVVSQIKAIDRNNDGLADHLYFGDLGGQVWRVDLNASSNAGDTENFAKRAVRILDMSTAAKVPRFYSTPTFTIHNSVNGYFGVLTIGSGNLSYPMSAENQNDALYVVYDKDVTKRNLSVLKDSELSTIDVSPSGQGGKKLVANANGNTGVSLSNGGWYYTLPSKNRILNDNVAIDNDLYISVFDSTVDISDVDCVGGVRGKSIAQQYCLPFGQCLKKDASGNNVSENRPDDIELGRGNIGISFGGIDKKRGLVLNLPTDKPLKSYQGKTKFISQRWYER
ncbi:pilus assembly protein [Acinetobacter sp. YH12145]|uniref:pilus assembly protein n=1 Tax=Acinetobacter sp. YH12145 TaxID=2601129 RepID=UPI0015D307D9|nr:PilC/PilY family type IV pilus protein [Acinetobacter sp. YH12145]